MTEYNIFDSTGKQVLESTEECRYSRDIELSLLSFGYKIVLNGKRITKKSLSANEKKK